MNTAERRQCCLSGAFIVKWEYVSQVVLIADFEQANVCWVHIENT